MKVKTTKDCEIDLTPKMLGSLKMRPKGQVLTPGEIACEESRTVWNAMIDRKPAKVARCLGIADVIARMQFARENDILLSIKGGGHNIA